MNDAQFRKKLWAVYGPKPKPLMTLEQELAEIRARHERRRAYNREVNAAGRRRRALNAIASNVVAESHD